MAGGKFSEKVSKKLLTILRIEKGVKKEIEKAVTFGRKSPLPEPSEALEDIYTNQESEKVNL